MIFIRRRCAVSAKLAYNSVAAWLEGSGPIPEAVAAVPGLDASLRLQDKAAQSMQTLRHANGALSLETIEAKPIFDGDRPDWSWNRIKRTAPRRSLKIS